MIKDKDEAVMGADSATQVDPVQSSKTLERLGALGWLSGDEGLSLGKAPETAVGGERLERC